jgi:hypothetical protein
MFDQKRSRSDLNWAGIILVVVFVLAVFWLYRQNPPDAEADAPSAKPTAWTSGTIIAGPLEVEGGGLLTFRMDLNKRSTLDAVFTTGDSAIRLAFTVLAAGDLEGWKSGERVDLITNTGPVPRGTVKRVIEPGSYVIVFDNRMNPGPVRIVEADVKVE